MRVIAGELGGRLFASPSGHATHPMSDRVKGGLFGILGDITGLTVLDAFAGSGALAFEAVSRGAKNALIIESDRAAQKVIESNMASLGITNHVRLVRAPAEAWARTNGDATFDIVLCDPPFDNLQPKTLQKLSSRVAENGVMVVCWPGKLEPPELTGLTLHTQRGYGDAQLLFFTR